MEPWVGLAGDRARRGSMVRWPSHGGVRVRATVVAGVMAAVLRGVRAGAVAVEETGGVAVHGAGGATHDAPPRRGPPDAVPSARYATLDGDEVPSLPPIRGVGVVAVIVDGGDGEHRGVRTGGR